MEIYLLGILFTIPLAFFHLYMEVTRKNKLHLSNIVTVFVMIVLSWISIAIVGFILMMYLFSYFIGLCNDKVIYQRKK